MFKDVFRGIGSAARDLFKNWQALTVLSFLYAATLVMIYWFFAIGVATAWQLFLSAAIVVLAPLLFFFLQAGVVHHALGATDARQIVRSGLRDFWKLLLVSIPLIALAVLALYLLNKLHAKFPVPAEELRRSVPIGAGPNAAPPPLPMRWQDVTFAALRLLLAGAVVPLIAIQFWLTIGRSGLVSALKGAHRVIGRALSPVSVFIYAVGLFFFALIPYVVVYTSTQIKNGWVEVIIFAIRILIAFALTLWGWLLTVGAIAHLTGPAGAETTSQDVSATDIDPQTDTVPSAQKA